MRILLIFSLLFLSFYSHAQRWQQHVDYQIIADMDAAKHQYHGTLRLAYTNNSPDTLYKVFWHLYFNVLLHTFHISQCPPSSLMFYACFIRYICQSDSAWQDHLEGTTTPTATDLIHLTHYVKADLPNQPPGGASL